MTQQTFKLPGRPYTYVELDRYRLAGGGRESLCKCRETGGMVQVPTSMVEDATDPTNEMDAAMVERTWPSITPTEDTDRREHTRRLPNCETGSSSVFARLPTASLPSDSQLETTK